MNHSIMTLQRCCLSVLSESNIGGLLSEALTGDVKTVLADQSVAGGSDTAC